MPMARSILPQANMDQYRTPGSRLVFELVGESSKAKTFCQLSVSVGPRFPQNGPLARASFFTGVANRLRSQFSFTHCSNRVVSLFIDFRCLGPHRLAQQWARIVEIGGIKVS